VAGQAGRQVKRAGKHLSPRAHLSVGKWLQEPVISKCVSVANSIK